MRRVLITTGIFPPDIGGPASYARILSDALAERGFIVEVITYSGGKNLKLKNQNEKLQFKNKNFKIIRISRKWPKGIRHLIYFFRTFFLVKKADVVLSLNAISAGLPALISAKIFKKKFIVRIVGDYAWEIGAGKGKVNILINDFQKAKKGGWTGFLYKLQSWVCRNTDGIIVPSQYLADIVVGWGVSLQKIHIIYNGTNFKLAGLSKEEARKEIRISGNIILSIGRLVPWKGFKMLVKIMPQLLGINQFFRLVIVGDGPEKNKLEAMIKNLGLERKVYIAGKKNQNELAVYLAAADIFILNTGYEGFSHQILETMAAGVPVITTAVGGNKEIMIQGENGFMIHYNDEFNIIEAIKSLWQNPNIREEFIKNGKETAEQFSVDKMIEKTMEVLKI